MRYLTIDTSIFVAAVREVEKKHADSKKLLQKIVSGEFKAIEPYTVLVEVAAAVKRRTGSTKLAERVKENLLAIEGITFEELIKFRAEKASGVAIEAGFRGMDAIVVQIAKENNCTLVTLDHELAEKAKGIVSIEEVEKLA